MLKKKTENIHWSWEDVRKPTARDNHYSKYGDYHLLKFQLHKTHP